MRETETTIIITTKVCDCGPFSVVAGVSFTVYQIEDPFTATPPTTR
jgi:hypothetical protein